MCRIERVVEAETESSDIVLATPVDSAPEGLGACASLGVACF